MDIRPATAEDVPAVLPMVRQLCVLHQEWDAARYACRADPGEMYRHWLIQRATDARAVFLVAQRESGPPPVLAGFLIATIEKEIPIYKTAEYGFIHDLWVEESYRREGIARQMVMLAIERFNQLGMEQVRLATAAANDAARALFRSCDFRACIVEMITELKDRP